MTRTREYFHTSRGNGVTFQSAISTARFPDWIYSFVYKKLLHILQQITRREVGLSRRSERGHKEKRSLHLRIASLVKIERKT